MKKNSTKSLHRWIILVASIPPSLGLIILMLWDDFSLYLVILIALMLCMLIGYCAKITIQMQNNQMTTLMNLIESTFHNDFSLPIKYQNKNKAFMKLTERLNNLAFSMHQQRLIAKQQQYLIKKIINNIDVAIIAINNQQQVAFINDTAANLLNMTPNMIQGKLIDELLFSNLFEKKEDGVIEWDFPNRRGKFKIRHDCYFEDGLPQRLLFITDVSQLLREEEYRAWRNLLRVISHEINNTLTPISSLSQVLLKLLNDEDERFQDIRDGLHIIHERVINLSRFIDGYRKLESLPPPNKKPVNIAEIIKNLQPLFEHRKIVILSSCDVLINVDKVQIEHLLINILKNADQSMPKSDGIITLNGQIKENKFYLELLDEGCGITNPKNLFIPFYTTKEQGCGIGLMLSRQIIESHEGHLDIQNRDDRQGCKVTIILPI